MVIFAFVLVQAAPAQDESIIVEGIAANEGDFVGSPADDQQFLLKLLKLKKLLLLG